MFFHLQDIGGFMWISLLIVITSIVITVYSTTLMARSTPESGENNPVLCAKCATMTTAYKGGYLIRCSRCQGYSLRHPRDANWMQRRSIALLHDAIVTMYLEKIDQSKITSTRAIRVLYVKRWTRHISSFLGVDVSSVRGITLHYMHISMCC